MHTKIPLPIRLDHITKRIGHAARISDHPPKGNCKKKSRGCQDKSERSFTVRSIKTTGDSAFLRVCTLSVHPMLEESSQGGGEGIRAARSRHRRHPRAIFQFVGGISGAVQCGFCFHPKDKDLSLGTPGLRKKPLSHCGFALKQPENRSRPELPRLWPRQMTRRSCPPAPASEGAARVPTAFRAACETPQYGRRPS